MNQILITVSKIAVRKTIKTIEDLQESMGVLSEESTESELKVAYHNHGIAQGYIRCLKELELISGPDYSRLFMRQIKISERISELQKRRDVRNLEDTR